MIEKTIKTLKVWSIGLLLLCSNAMALEEVVFQNKYVREIELGMDFAVRFQDLQQENDSESDPVGSIDPGFSNSQGNARFLFKLDKGVRSYIEIYLSSEHHLDVWMREGYLELEELPMIESDLVSNLMRKFTLKAGQMEINYGDYHFWRTDNAQSFKNPLIGNYIIDSNTTEIAIEALYQGEVEVLLGFSGGTTTGETDEGHGWGRYGKLAYEKGAWALSPRLSFSYYRADHSDNATGRVDGATNNFLYSGNRSGSPYQALFGAEVNAGEVLPNASQDIEAHMVNLDLGEGPWSFFINYDVVAEFDADGRDSDMSPNERWQQFAIDVKYEFTEKLYAAARLNQALHLQNSDGPLGEKVERIQAGGGYFLTKSMLLKAELVRQKYLGFENKFKGGEFYGAIGEAAVRF